MRHFYFFIPIFKKKWNSKKKSVSEELQLNLKKKILKKFGKNKKKIYIKMSITTIKNFKSSQISLGNEEQKRSKTGFKYSLTPIFYDEKPLDLLLKGRLRIFKHDKDYTISLDVDEANKSFFESVEEKIKQRGRFLRTRLDLIKGGKIPKSLF